MGYHSSWMDFINFIKYLEQEYLDNPTVSDEIKQKWNWVNGLDDDWKNILENRWGLDLNYRPSPDPLFPIHQEFLKQGFTGL